MSIRCPGWSGGIEGPIVGSLIDKFGARKLIFVGVTLAGAGFIALALVVNAWSLYLIFGLLLSMGYNTGFFHATTAATANWLIKRRSRALSFITAGGGIGGAVMVPVLALLITQFGWRGAAVIMGFGEVNEAQNHPLPANYRHPVSRFRLSFELYAVLGLATYDFLMPFPLSRSPP